MKVNGHFEQPSSLGVGATKHGGSYLLCQCLLKSNSASNNQLKIINTALNFSERMHQGVFGKLKWNNGIAITLCNCN